MACLYSKDGKDTEDIGKFKKWKAERQSSLCSMVFFSDWNNGLWLSAKKVWVVRIRLSNRETTTVEYGKGSWLGMNKGYYNVNLTEVR